MENAEINEGESRRVTLLGEWKICVFCIRMTYLVLLDTRAYECKLMTYCLYSDHICFKVSSYLNLFLSDTVVL